MKKLWKIIFAFTKTLFASSYIYIHLKIKNLLIHPTYNFEKYPKYNFHYSLLKTIFSSSLSTYFFLIINSSYKWFPLFITNLNFFTHFVSNHITYNIDIF